MKARSVKKKHEQKKKTIDEKNFYVVKYYVILKQNPPIKKTNLLKIAHPVPKKQLQRFEENKKILSRKLQKTSTKGQRNLMVKKELLLFFRKKVINVENYLEAKYSIETLKKSVVDKVDETDNVDKSSKVDKKGKRIF